MRLDPAPSRLLAVLLFVVVLAIAYFVLVHWWFVAPQLRIADDMADVRDTHSRFAAAIAERPHKGPSRPRSSRQARSRSEPAPRARAGCASG